MQKNNNLQEIFLTKARKQSIPLTIVPIPPVSLQEEPCLPSDE